MNIEKYPLPYMLYKDGAEYFFENQSLADAIKCLDCDMTSHNKNDVINRYCGNCHQFLQTRMVTLKGDGSGRFA